MSNLVIGIEGLVGAGKTSICRELLKEIPNTILINATNIYRAIVATIVKSGYKLEELQNLAAKTDVRELIDKLDLQLKLKNNETQIYILGKQVDEEYIQSKEISMAVSLFAGRAKEEKLYEFARDLINNYKNNYNVIISARDIKSIYPECDYHLFITADLDTRVKRKLSQYDGATEEEIRNNIIKRDKLQKEVGYYELGENTKIIDVSDCKSIKESTKKVLEFLDTPLLSV